MSLRYLFFTSICTLLIVACDDGLNYAPVTEINMIEAIPSSGVHQVTQGETLYEIAWRYGLDYRFLASRNQINAPYTIHVGQDIYLDEHKVTASKSETNSLKLPSKPLLEKEIEANFHPDKWIWPSKGKVINSFSVLNKGLNIVNHQGTPIYATAAGKVVYSGSGLRGYGNLIIVKHNSVYLSAYAHNKRILVKEGDMVAQGQKIAEMGHTGSEKVMLHFEIRKAGKPINPMKLLSLNG